MKLDDNVITNHSRKGLERQIRCLIEDYWSINNLLISKEKGPIVKSILSEPVSFPGRAKGCVRP